MALHVCPVFHAADLVGKKWSIPLIQEIALNGEKGFNAIFERMQKISPKVLSTRLNELEKEGIIQRKVFTDIPLRTSYSLTSKGKDLQNIIGLLKEWEKKYSGELGECDKRACTECSFY